MPKTPTRHLLRALRHCCGVPARSVPPVLIALALVLLTGCGGENRAPPDAADATDPQLGAATPDSEGDADPLAQLTIVAEDRTLVARWSFAPSQIASAGTAPRVRLRLDNTEDTKSDDGELLEPAYDEPSSGTARLAVATHRLAWRTATLAAELVDADGTLVASSSALAIDATLAATTHTLAPAISVAGERIGDALAYSADGGTLAIALPAAGEVRLLPADSGSANDIDARDGFAVDGLAGAAQVRIAMASFGATIGVWWRSGEQDASTLAIIEPFGEGWLERARVAFDSLATPALQLAADGRSLLLATADGRHERFVSQDDVWLRDPARQSVTAADTIARSEDDALRLTNDDAGALALQAIEPDGSPGARTSLPGTATLAGRLTPGVARIALDPSRRRLAVGLFVQPDAEPPALLPTLLLFERDDLSGPWRLADRLERAPTSMPDDLVLAFAGEAGAQLLRWSWTGSSEPAAAVATQDEGMSSGLVVLTRRPASAAFGTAARTELPDSRWIAGFELPRDGAAFDLAHPHASAALSPAGDRLAIAWPPAPDTGTAQSAQRTSTRAGTAYPAGQIRLLD